MPKFEPKFDGVKSVAELLQNLDQPTRERILKEMKERDPKVTEAVMNQMFLFEDLAKLPPTLLQKLFRDVPQKKLALALRGASEGFLKVVFGSMSKQSAQWLAEAVQAQGPSRRPDVEAAQLEVIRLAQKLASQP